MELPARFVRDHVDAARACGLDVDELFVGLRISPARLADPKARVLWNDFAELTDRIGARLGSNARIEEFGSLSVKLSAPWALFHLVPHVVGPSFVLRIGVQFTGPAIFPHIRHVLEKREGGAFRLRLSLPPPYRGCETFFRACVGGIGVIPTLFNYKPARVVPASIGPRGGVFDVTPPPNRTVLHRVRSAVRALRGESVLFDEIARQHEATQGVFGMLLRTQTELHQLMERIPEPLVVHRAGVVLWMNQAFLTALRLASIDDIRDKAILDILHPADKDLALRLEEDSVAGRPETLRFRVSDGTFRSFEVSEPQSVIFEEAPARMTLARDVTERDALREQLVLADRMSQLGLMAAGVAHEINNPLAYALAALDRAKRDLGLGRFESAAEALSIARGGAERVRGITNDLRIFARGGDPRPEVADVAEVLRATADLAGPRIRSIAHLALDLRPTPHVFADVGRLGQVFMNLLVNAIDAIAERDPKTNRISVRSFADSAGRAVVEIEDNGSGIAEDVRARIFEPFFTTKGPRAGSGLGLAICHRIVTDLGGGIEVEASPQGGALFRVLLAPDASRAAARTGSVTRPRSVPRLRVLVVDDEPPLASALGRMLEDEHDVEVVTSGEDALTRLEADGAYDAILCDLMMAGMGGMEVHARLSAGRPALARRLVFMTGGAFNPSAQRFLGEVKNPCLDKPFTKDEVLGAMHAVSRLG
jgi:two-component system cell cycle sensor histidine kinase/response regulator CckA